MLTMKFLGMLAGFIAILSGSSSGAVACSCIDPPFHQAFRSSTAVFSGKVVAVDSVSVERDDRVESAWRIAFEVSRQWKGDVGTTVFVTTSPSSSSCGYEFMRGATYLVYAREFEDDRYLSTSLCSRNRVIGLGENDLAELGEGRPPVDNARRYLIYSLAGVSVIALLGGLFLFGRSRRHT